MSKLLVAFGCCGKAPKKMWKLPMEIT